MKKKKIKNDIENKYSFKNYLFSFFIKSLIVVIFFLLASIYINISSDNKKKLKNIVYNYEIPEGYIIDTKSIKYNLNGALCNIFFKTINNNIVFKFSNIPGNTYDNKKIIISLKHIDTNTLLGPSFMILN